MPVQEYVEDLLSFLSGSPTASAAVSNVAEKLERNGYRLLSEDGDWKVQPGSRFYTIRSSSSIIAGIVGSEPLERAGCRLVGAHTDSPGFRIKPSAKRTVEGINVLGIEVYGGPILATWFDRDLSMAGSLAVLENGTVGRVPFALEKPLFRMATPAIHMERSINKEGFKVDSEKNTPLLFSTSGAELDDVISLACESAGVDRESAKGWSLQIWDPQPAVTGGIDDDFIFSGRIDNLSMCHAAVEALLACGEPKPSTSLICLFNSEEVGSRTLNGAASSFLDNVLERLAGSRGNYFRCLNRSIQVSADGAHALHPNYAGKHDPACRPRINAGPVIKVNAKERYTSNDLTTAYFVTCAERCGVNVQYFVSRNDMPCGSTIGPITSTRTGIKSVDAGNPMLSMHSVRETAGAADHGDMIKVLAEHLLGSTGITG